MSKDFSEYLQQLGLGELYPILSAHDIDETLITELDDADLREVGLSLGQRKKLLKALQSASRESRPETQPVAERRQLTVAFCDLVGSTKLATELDVEAMREVISSYQSTCQEVMRAHGGHIAYTQGDGLMVYFGYPVAHEHDASFAIRAGLATIEAVLKLDTPATQGLSMRVGIATGIVVVGDLIGEAMGQNDFVVGEAPNLASRLQGLAKPGEVVIAQETRELAGREFIYEDMGTPQMKGFPEGLKVFRVLEESGVQSRFDARIKGSLGPLIGREAELAELVGLWKDVTSGEGRLCQIMGTAGIGKSRLTRALTDSIPNGSATVLQLQCASHLANRALHPITREISRAAGLEKTDSDQTIVARLEDMIASFQGLSADDLPLLADLIGVELDTELEMDAGKRAQLTQRMLLRWVGGQTLSGPVLIVFEDAHWADATTQEFLNLLVSKIETLPILLIVTFRPEFVPPWTVPGSSRHIALEPLDEAAGSQLIEQVTGLSKLPRVLAREIIRKTDGVPLFLEELTKTVLEAGAQETGTIDVSSLEALSIPATLQDSLMERLDRLSIGKKVAQLGSVIGREFSLDMVASVAPPELDLKSGLQQVLESGLLQQVKENGGHETFMFNHALVQDVAYESILKSTRKQYHQSLAEVMLNGHPAFGSPEPEVLARHSDLGGLNYEAMQNWLAAGRHALRSANNLAAITYLRSALKQLGTLPEGPKTTSSELAIQMSLAPACMAIFGWGSPEVEQTCARAKVLALELGDHEALFGALWGLWTNYFLRGELEPALATALETDAMAKVAGVPMLLTAADHAVGYTQFFRGELADALDRAERGLARFSEEVEAQIIQTFQFSSTVALRAIRSATLWQMGQTEEADNALQEGLNFAEALKHLPSFAYCLGSTGQELVLRRDWERLAEIAQQCLRLSQEEGFLLWERVAAVQCAIARGQREKSKEAIAEIDIERDRFFATQTVLTDVLIYPAFAELMIETGQAEEARKRLDKVISEAERRKEGLNLPEVYRMRGEAKFVLGDLREAKADFVKALDLAQVQGAVRLAERATASLLKMGDTLKTETVK